MVGEHVVLLEALDDGVAPVLDWLRGRGVRPAQVLEHWHVPLDARGLAEFVSTFPATRCEVRPPTLDDLLLALAEESPTVRIGR